MKASSIISSILSFIFKIVFISVFAVLLYKYTFVAYDFGQRIFAEEPMSGEPGITKTVSIVEGKSTKEIGVILENNGLIRDSRIFYFQELLSEYHGYLKPGVYELNTSQTIDEMLEVMADKEALETKD